jgi:hypothetical protein
MLFLRRGSTDAHPPRFPPSRRRPRRLRLWLRRQGRPRRFGRCRRDERDLDERNLDERDLDERDLDEHDLDERFEQFRDGWLRLPGADAQRGGSVQLARPRVPRPPVL